MIGDGGFFDVGKRNYLSCRKALWKVGLMIHAEAIGGNVCRSVRVEIGTGKIWIKEGEGSRRELLPPRRGILKDGRTQ
jgi:chemotaxis protein CheD